MLLITPIGITDWRNHHQVFGIKDKDRLSHIYAIGKTGTGKSTLLLNMAISDIERGNGICILDPHGDLANTILNYIPKERIEDVIYFNTPDIDHPIAFNPLSCVDPGSYNLVTSNLISTFKKIWADSWGPRLEHILRFSLLTLLHYPYATLLDIHTLLANPFFKAKVLNHVPDELLLNFWNNEYDKYPPALRAEAIAPILNKTGLLIASLPLRNIVGQQQSSFKMQEVLDKRKILICNLSKGSMGEEASSLLGSMILTAIQSTVLQRASYEPEKRIPFYTYIDEAHSFLTLSITDILAESRKYGLSLFLTHQYIEQLDERIKSAIFGNVGTLISFRVGAMDAECLTKEFHPSFQEDDLVNLPRYSMYIKLMIDGAMSKPFSAKTIPIKNFRDTFKMHITQLSQKKYTKHKNEVEKIINKVYFNTLSKKNQHSLFDTNEKI